MSKILCVYCSSSDRLDPKYYSAAKTFGRTMAARHWGLVYGGGRTGLMGALAHAVKSEGGHVIGVIPAFMEQKELAFAAADELVVVDTMRERKHIMASRADAFVALPGGWGTLEEVMEIVTLRQLNVLQRPCVFFNQDGFYDDLLRLFERMIAEHFNKPSTRELFGVAHGIDEVFELLERSQVAAESKWFETR